MIVVTLDISPLYLRLASIAIPLPFGFLLIWHARHGILWAVIDGILVGLVAVAGMLIAVAVIDKVSVLPENAREWRETLEYVASIALANITGAVLGIFVRRMLPRTLDATGAPGPAALTIARIAGRHVGTQALRRRDRSHGLGRGRQLFVHGHSRPGRVLICVQAQFPRVST